MVKSFKDPRDATAYALLVEVVACLVDSPERIYIAAKTRDGKVYFGISGDPRDARFLGAERGQLAEAIRTLMKALGQHSGRRYVVYFEATTYLVSHDAPTELAGRQGSGVKEQT